MERKVFIEWTKNTSLQSDIQRCPELAAQIKRKYPHRFKAIAGPNYKEPAPRPEVRP
jgi:hypothetical protein